MEKLLLRALLAGEKLHVVDQQHVRTAVAAAEFLEIAAAHGIDELVGEFLAGQIDHARARLAAEDFLADGLHQVGLAEAGAAVDEERVITDAGFLGHRLAGGVGELAVSTDHEAREGVGRVESRALDAALQRLAFQRRRPCSAATAACRVSRGRCAAVERLAGVLADHHTHLAHLVENPVHRHRQLRQVVGLDPHLMDLPGNA